MAAKTLDNFYGLKSGEANTFSAGCVWRQGLEFTNSRPWRNSDGTLHNLVSAAKFSLIHLEVCLSK